MITITSPTALLYDAYYHIYNRGVNRENIFVEERNYFHFLKLYAKYIEPVAETFAYCLLRNHFHVLVKIRTEEEIKTLTKTLRVFETLRVSEPSIQFSNLLNAYAKAINKAYGRSGSLFQHPFGRVLVTNSTQFYRVVMYIHQNPQKHKFVNDYKEWKYSSYDMLLSSSPTRLQRETVIDWFGGCDQFIRLHADWVTERESAGFAEDDDD